MAVTTNLVQRAKISNAFMNIVDVIVSGETYATGGISLVPSKLGLGSSSMIIPSPAGGYIFEFDHTSHKLKVFTPTNMSMSGAGGVAGADNTVIRLTDASLGISGTGDDSAISNAGVELANGTSLTVTMRLIAIGN